MRVWVGVRRIIFSISFYFCLVISYKGIGICILVCFLTRNIFMEADVSCESA